MVGDMPLPAKFFIAFVIVLALIGGVAWLVRRFSSGGLGSASARGRQARLGVIEATAVDSRRRLVLVRRDNVEHLIMLGGPTDVVVEANIVRGQPAAPMRDVPVPRLDQAGRPLPENGLWQTTPEPSFRNARGSALMPPLAEDLPLQPQVEPVPRPQTADRLAGLAAELARSAPPPIVEPRMAEPRMSEPRMPEARMPEARMAEPRVSEPRLSEPRGPEPRLGDSRLSEPRRPAPDLRRPMEPRRAPPAPPPAPTEDANAGDRQLAAMAEQLEAALRRPGAAEPAAAAEPAPAPPAPAQRPRLPPRNPLEPRSSLLSRPPAARPPAAEPPAPPVAPSDNGQASAPAAPFHAADEPHAGAPAPGPAGETPDKPGKTPYESLEEEMANLLGRAPGKP
ncbi:MAG: flagellar biosynthetic protein FliO [Rhodoplanes sp.]|uniref:flagellar biosynthetic protein FliO n=1 Tax=Rhodoplanes sp. TaxID=1968906 RepID=UPI0018299D3C|nr:flagellar biosynthetic protein FliO [Rhodoplanes sp.]NVO12721.1 flagellar biosynthetic protein FliO [Rhodoplanes sp.]